LQWPTKRNVNDLLREVLLSYRLLFGQTKASRKKFRSLQPFRGLHRSLHDSLLAEICGRRFFNVLPWTEERDEYDLAEDFPILGVRISVLHKHIARGSARGWRQIWRKQQFSEQWYTFWAVIVIGGLGLLLAVIQVILQGLQLAATYESMD
jgi:hypothetical protein